MLYCLPFSLAGTDAVAGGSARRLETTATTLRGAAERSRKADGRKHHVSRERKRIRKMGKGGELLHKRAQTFSL